MISMMTDEESQCRHCDAKNCPDRKAAVHGRGNYMLKNSMTSMMMDDEFDDIPGF